MATASGTKGFRLKQMKSFLKSQTRKRITVGNLAWCGYRACPDAQAWDIYITQRKHCVKLVNDDKRKHQQDVAMNTTNTKMLYRHVNKIRRLQRVIPITRAVYSLALTTPDATNTLRQQFIRN